MAEVDQNSQENQTDEADEEENSMTESDQD